MGSERLSGKVLKEIDGKPMILHVLDRVSKSKRIDQIILATSDLDRDTPLAKTVTEAGYKVYRGSEDNVLNRYVEALEKFSPPQSQSPQLTNIDLPTRKSVKASESIPSPPQGQSPDFSRKSEQALASSTNMKKDDSKETVIRITGDCPLIDATIIDDLIEQFESSKVDYLTNDVPKTVARGFDAEIFTKKALLKTAELADEPKYLEHVTHYIYTHKDEFKVKIVEGKDWQNRPYRLCVDTAEDFELVSKIYDTFDNHFVSTKDVVKYLDDNPDLTTINTEVKQGTIDLVTD